MARDPSSAAVAYDDGDASLSRTGATRACKCCKRRSSVDASKRCHACQSAVHPSCSGRVATRDCGLLLGFPDQRAYCSRRCYETDALSHQREVEAKMAALTQHEAPQETAADATATAMMTTTSPIALTPVVPARRSSPAPPPTTALVVTDPTPARPVSANNAPATSVNKRSASRKSLVKTKSTAVARHRALSRNAGSPANREAVGAGVIPLTAVGQQPPAAAVSAAAHSTVDLTQATSPPRRAAADRTPHVTSAVPPVEQAAAGAAPPAAPPAAPAYTSGASLAAPSNTRVRPSTAPTSRTASPAVTTTRSALPAVRAARSAPLEASVTRTPPPAAPPASTVPPASWSGAPVARASPPATRTAAPREQNARTVPLNEFVGYGAPPREAVWYGVPPPEGVGYGAPAPRAVGYAVSASRNARRAAAEGDSYAAPAELTARAPAYDAPAGRGAHAAAWPVAEAAPIVFPARGSPPVVRAIADATPVEYAAQPAAPASSPFAHAASSSLPLLRQRLSNLPDDITFVLTILIGEVGRTSRKHLSVIRFRFRLSDGFEVFQAEANARTAEEFQKYAATAYEPFVRNDRAVYIRPGLHSRQAEVVELTEKNFSSRITRSYHNFVKNKPREEHPHYECAIVTYVNKDSSHSTLADPAPYSAAATLQPPPPAGASANQHHSFVEYADLQFQQHQQQYYHPRHHSPPAVAMDNPVMVMPPSSAVSPAAAGSRAGDFNRMLPSNGGGHPYRPQKRTHSQLQVPNPSTPRSQSAMSGVDDGAYKTIRMVLNGLVVPMKVNVHDLLACTGLLRQQSPPVGFQNHRDDDDTDDDADDANVRMRRRSSSATNVQV